MITEIIKIKKFNYKFKKIIVNNRKNANENI